jgi:hypothetical protein
MPVLLMHPPNFVPGLCYTQEWYEKLQLNPDGFLWPEEEKLAHHLVREQEECLLWIEEEKGEFWQDSFPPVCILTVPHMPWVYKNIPIPPGPHDELVKIICDKIASGAYELSNAAYRSRWFCVIKWDGSSLRVVHNLRPFNAVTIRDASVSSRIARPHDVPVSPQHSPSHLLGYGPYELSPDHARRHQLYPQR